MIRGRLKAYSVTVQEDDDEDQIISKAVAWRKRIEAEFWATVEEERATKKQKLYQ